MQCSLDNESPHRNTVTRTTFLCDTFAVLRYALIYMASQSGPEAEWIR